MSPPVLHHDQTLPPWRDRLDTSEAFVLLTLAFVLLWSLGGVLVRSLGVFGLVLAELVLVLLPALVFTTARRVSLRLALRLEPPRGTALLGGLLAGLGGFFLVSLLIESLTSRYLPIPPAVREELERWLLPPEGLRPFALDWLVFAVLPAFCEEVLFRGALQSAFQPAGPFAAVGGTALAFGCYHGSVWKLLPTTLLGLLLGATAWRSRSLWPAVVVHLANNTLVLLMVRSGYAQAPKLESLSGLALFALSVALILGGMRLLRPPIQPIP